MCTAASGLVAEASMVASIAAGLGSAELRAGLVLGAVNGRSVQGMEHATVVKLARPPACVSSSRQGMPALTAGSSGRTHPVGQVQQ